MVNILAGQLGGAPIKYFADWTERVAKGELPSTSRRGRQGVERNVVVTTWDWAQREAISARSDRLATAAIRPSMPTVRCSAIPNTA